MNCCVLLEMDGEQIVDATVTMGSVAPTIVHSPEAEKYLTGRKLDRESAKIAGQLAASDCHPISDIRGGADYRDYMMQVIVEDALIELFQGCQDSKVPQNPVTLSKGDAWQAVPVANGTRNSFKQLSTVNFLNLKEKQKLPS